MTARAIAVGNLPVVVTEPDSMPAETLGLLKKIGPVELGPFERAQLIDAVRPAVVLMVRLHHMIDCEVLHAASHLQAIVSATTGLNHIDLAACQARGVEVICTRGERAFLSTITGTAELALALLLNLARNIIPAHADVQEGNWRRDAFRGISLRGLKLGIVGLGRLGCLMAGYGQALGMRVLAYDPAPLVVPPFVEMIDLEELMQQADAISLHASHSAGDPPLLCAREMARLKHGVLLVNTARGELIDETALLENLETGRIKACATDVVIDEAACGDFKLHPLVRYARRHSNLIITPHIGGATLDGLNRAEAFVVGKLLRRYGVEAPKVVL